MLRLLHAFFLFILSGLIFGILLSRQRVYLNGDWTYFVMDDIHISMRYAYQLVMGHGLVWNPGEYVQGYTNLGWTLLLTAGPLLGIDFRHAALVPFFANYLLVLFGLWLVYRFVAKANQANPWTALLAAATLLCSSVMLFCACFGFETILQALLLLGSGSSLIDGYIRVASNASAPPPFVSYARWWQPICSVLALAVRLDSVVFLGAIWTAELALRRRQPWSMLNYLMANVAPAWAAIIAILLFQKSYYGEWLPNTFYLKLSDAKPDYLLSTWQVLRHYILDGMWLVILALALAVLEGRKTAQTLLFCLTPNFALALYNILSGGDYFAKDFASRFLTMGDFYASIIAGTFLSRHPLFAMSYENRSWKDSRKNNTYSHLKPSSPKTILIVFCIGFSALSVVRSSRLLTNDSRWVYNRLVGTAQALREQLRIEPQARIALFPAGLIPHFLPEYRFIDMLGKCDATIARIPGIEGLPIGHNKYDFSHSIQTLKPEYVITGNYQGWSDLDLERHARINPYRHEQDLMLFKAFRNSYSVVKLVHPKRPQHESIWIWKRNAEN